MELQIQKIIKDLYAVDRRVDVVRTSAQFGDFSTNIALILAGILKMPPIGIAKEIVECLKYDDKIKDVSIAGQGFINIKLSDQFLWSNINTVLNDFDKYYKYNKYANKNVVIEYSDPNPFKVLHIGHLYTSVVGDAISNIIQFAGAKIKRVNFGGDVGLHVAKTMWSILHTINFDSSRLDDIPVDKRSDWLAEKYVSGTREYEENDESRKDIIELNRQIYEIHNSNDHETELSRVYWRCRDWSYAYFKDFYKKINTKFDVYYPESQVANIGLDAVRGGLEKGIFEASQGAVVFPGDRYGLHTRVFINKNGLPTYEAKDVGLSIKKWNDYHFDESIIITGNDITEYMKVVLKSIEQLNPILSERTVHITHGNVKLSGNVKMSSRKGNFIKAEDVLDLVAREIEKDYANDDRAIILGAVKFAFLKNRTGPDMIFDPKSSISLAGNSGPYLQYSLARANSILSKTSYVPQTGYVEPLVLDELNDFERKIILKMMDYANVLKIAVDDLSPHVIAGYLYELAQEFSRFYENNKVIGNSSEKQRVRIVRSYQSVMRHGFQILNIPTVIRI